MFSFIKRLFQKKDSPRRETKDTVKPTIQPVPTERSLPPSNVKFPEYDAKIDRILSVLEKQLSLNEFRDICFSLEIPFEFLPGNQSMAR